MNIRINRTFLPVGHGAFFVERLYVDEQRVLTAVYDCGDSSRGKLVERYTLQEFGNQAAPIEKIDLLFISHFDSDHVNGLIFLQPYLTKKTLIFIPFYHKELQIVYGANKRTGIFNVDRILMDIGINPIMVCYSNREERLQIDPIDIDEFSIVSNGTSINSGQPITKKEKGIPIWKYVPFNLFNEQKLFRDFKNNVHNNLHWTDAKLQDATQWTDQDIKSLRQIYRGMTSYSINDNSLIVLSDRTYIPDECTIEDYVIRIIGELLNYNNNYLFSHCHSHSLCHSPHCDNSCCHNYGPGCLYTGDTVLKRGARKNSKYFEKYEKFVEELHLYTNYISLMQIPHHGSSNNINIHTLCDGMSHCMFCNYSTKDVKNKTFILKNKVLDTIWKNIYSVTEDKATKFEKDISFYI